jgi:RNA polymerase sigma factor (sigma-70 family)
MQATTDPIESTALIEAARQGDTQALETILLHYQPAVTRFARKYCATPQDVEDAVQETLWVASRKIGALRVSTRFVAWLFRIVRNQCYQLLRGGRDDTDLPDLEDRLISSEADPAQYTLLQQDVIRALSLLPASYREVILLRDVQELTAPQTAEHLHITVEAVKARLHRARAMLREMLEQ